METFLKHFYSFLSFKFSRRKKNVENTRFGEFEAIDNLTAAR